ncbi:hypothetical protein C4573_01785 [Candidatus Woesearchaeota archaeon]|nr:MAG: hypothetical protein C4573_01785 [Candidatus Woesearchaeota archaeon]
MTYTKFNCFQVDSGYARSVHQKRYTDIILEGYDEATSTWTFLESTPQIGHSIAYASLSEAVQKIVRSADLPYTVVSLPPQSERAKEVVKHSDFGVTFFEARRGDSFLHAKPVDLAVLTEEVFKALKGK